MTNKNFAYFMKTFETIQLTLHTLWGLEKQDFHESKKTMIFLVPSLNLTNDTVDYIYI